MTNKFPKKLIVIIISICLGFFTLPVFSMSETQIKYCNDTKSIYENNCTYLQQRIEKDVIQNKEDLTAEGEIQERYVVSEVVLVFNPVLEIFIQKVVLTLRKGNVFI